ncbi:MAG: segregation/condensation protein A [Clostridia bacterium]|nr:segregation/condensation protein A [Clostridia bacterium]MBQ4327399.1 segregation/condensation protein A [Clostridia bacterium]
MDTITYRLDSFEGPLDLLLTLIDKNKVSIADIPIALICDQYMEYIKEAQHLDMEVAAEFIVMASELMLIKSKMLLPRPEEEEEDPRAALADALLRYKQAKEAAQKMNALYATYSGRMIKDTDEISPDRKFVADQDAVNLYAAIKRVIALNSAMERAEKTHFTPLIQKPIVSVELKIIGILERMSKKSESTLGELLAGAQSRADLVAAFIGILELVKVRRVLIADEGKDEYGADTRLVLNPDVDDSAVNVSID